MRLRPLLDEFAEALLPQRCVACSRFGAALHASCVALMPLADGTRCERCWTPLNSSQASTGSCPRCALAIPAFDALRARFRFEGDARRALLEAKFRGVTSLLPPLAEAAVEAVPSRWEVDVVAPVPLHSGRQRRRGYNQAAILAKVVAGSLGVSYRPRLLHRKRATPPQAGLAAEARRRNLLGAFEVCGSMSGAVLLIDDVTTTGATFEAAASALRSGGAHSVYALAIARQDELAMGHFLWQLVPL